MPISQPAASTTGSPLIRFCSINPAASKDRFIAPHGNHVPRHDITDLHVFCPWLGCDCGLIWWQPSFKMLKVRTLPLKI